MAKTPSNQLITQELMDKYPIPTHLSPSEFIEIYWALYESLDSRTNSMNGAIFENLVVIALAREGIKNIYYQTSLSFVQSALFDVFLYHEEKPVALSIKTSLRERWKQADLEAAALKQVHKKAECYVLTLNEREIRVRQNKKNNYAGLNGFILTDSSEFDRLIDYLKTRTFSVAGEIPIIQTNHKRYNNKSLFNYFHFKT